MQSFLKNMLSSFVGAVKRSGNASFNAPSERVLPLKDVEDSEIPRYPPFAKGLPIASVDRVLETQAELIERIRTALGFNATQFEALLLPVLRNYASFVHLLPASEAHHHRGAGGLFRHGLEAAFGAAQASDGVVFSIVGTPKQKRDNEPRWRLVSTLAGLLHDVGKPLSDMTITDGEGDITWNPYSEFLFDWAKRNKVERYFLRWRDSRHKRHERFSLLAVDRIIPAATREFIAEPGPAIMEALLEAVSGTSIDNPVTKLMIFADKESVKRDLKQSRLNVDEFSYGVPVERYVFDAIRRLVNSGKWKVNKPGSKVWHLHDGVFIAWRSLGDMYDLISKDKIPGIPKDPDTLADILIERGFALQNKVTENGVDSFYRYWEVQPEGVPAKILMLRFDSQELVFTSEPPPPIHGVITGEIDRSNTALSTDDSAQSDAEEDQDQQTEDAAYDCSTEDNEEQINNETDLDTLESVEAISKEVDDLFGDIGVSGVLDMLGSSSAADEENKQTETLNEDAPCADEEVDNESDDSAPPVFHVPEPIQAPEKHKAKKPANKIVSHVKPETPARALKPEDSSPSITHADPAVNDESASPTEALRAIISNMPNAGPLLEKILLPVLSDASKLDQAVTIIRGQTVIPFPSGINGLGDKADVINILDDDGAIQINPVMPGRKVQDVSGIKCLILNARISDAFKEAIGYQIGSDTRENKKARSKSKPYTELLTTKVKSGLKTLSAAAKSSMSDEKVSTTQNRTVFKPLERPVKAVAEKQSKSVIKAKIEDYEVSDSGSNPDKEKTVLQLKDCDDFVSTKGQIENVIEAFRDMLIKGEGRWILTPVITNPDGSLTTGSQCIDQMVFEHPAFSKSFIRRSIMDAGFIVTNKQITLKKIKEDTRS